MIFYFSGTGNSLYAAKSIASKQGLQAYDIAELTRKKQWVFVPEESEIVGFVFPVYAWGPPEIVLQFIKKLRLVQNSNYIFAVATCGADVGNSMKILKNALTAASISLHADFSVLMPDNFITGYPIVSKEKQLQILKISMEQLDTINERIKSRLAGSYANKGPVAFLKSGLVNLLFNKFYNPAKKFTATDACISCGLCARICPAQNIVLDPAGKPRWGTKCYDCLACIHRCPTTAIECGKSTVGRLRYYNPYCNKDDA